MLDAKLSSNLDHQDPPSYHFQAPNGKKRAEEHLDFIPYLVSIGLNLSNKGSLYGIKSMQRNVSSI